MKTFTQLTLAGFLILVSWSLSAQISIGGYNVYYGHLHNHCKYSDGTGTPAQAYTYARDNGMLDFFSLADHEYSLTAAEYTQMKKTADSINADGVFTAFYGFEWSHSTYGHVAVIGSPDYCLSGGTSPTNTFSGLVSWLSTRDVVAFFNHPGRQNSTGVEFNHFTSAPSEKLVGMELWNKADRFEIYYYNDGYFTGDGTNGFYDEALLRDWKIGASGSEDNHWGSWGTYANSKMAVLASAKTRTDILNALKAKRFYSTYDKTLALSFKINGNEMGSTITAATYQYQILLSDGNGEVFSQVQLLKKGTVVQTWTPNTSSTSITGNLTCSDGDYYYIRVKQYDNDEAISSPIWIEGGMSNTPPSINITSPVTASTYTAPAAINITANASDTDGTIAKVEFFQGNTKLGEDTTSPFSFAWNNVPVGTYVITSKATDNLGAFTTSSPMTIGVYNPSLPNTVSTVIAAGTDDAEESATGAVVTTSTDLELVNDSGTGAGDQVVGMRFTNLLIPQGAHINSAYIQFTCDETNTAACSLTIKGQAADNSAAFSAATGNISGRAKTTSSVAWIPAGWPTADVAGTDQRTPELAPIVQEIVDLSGFTSSSPITIIITGSGTGKRVAEAFEGVPASAAKLVIEFVLATPVTPVFTQIGPLCHNSAPPTLPLVSTNGITGTWSPLVISTVTPGTTVYTFTPTIGQNATTTTMSITVNPLITPTFAQIGPFKQGSVPPALPAISLNSITGTWNPSVISTTAVGTLPYIFTPNAGQCAVPVTIQIVIVEKVPPVVQIIMPVSGTIYTAPVNVTISATASDADGTITKVEFYQGSSLLGFDLSSPYSYTWTGVPQGSYQLTAVATDNDGLITTSDIVNITVNSAPLPLTFEKRIISGSDDVEEYNSGTMKLTDSDLELVYDTKSSGNQKVGLRFQGVTLQKGVTISKAYIQFTVDEIKTATVNLLIQGQNADNAAAFTTSKKNVSNRTRTLASASWIPSAWSTTGVVQQTPDLKAIVQEIVNRTNWTPGNSMAFIISGTGTRTAVAYETSSGDAALLHVEYTSPSAGSSPIASEKSAKMPAVQRTEGKLTCYPVPFTDVLNISFEPAENETLHHFAIYSISGTLMKKIQTGANDLSVGMEDLSPGIYLIEAQTDCNRYIKTIVKK